MVVLCRLSLVAYLSYMRIVFTGGGTGGHFFPILAVIRELKMVAEEKQILDLELFYIAPDDFGMHFMREEGVTTLVIPSGKWRRYFSWSNFTDIFKTCIALIRTFWNLFLIMPDVVFSKGGYGAFPTVLIAALFRIPIIIHESDAVPGGVNLFSARFARRIGVSFAHALPFFQKEKTALVGVPIRKRVLGKRTGAREDFNIFSDLPIIGVIGGSQGAARLNEAVLGTLKELTDSFEVLHQTGTEHYTAVKEEAAVILEGLHSDRYHPYPTFGEDAMSDFYNVSELIISRAGATSIFEIAAWGKPSIMVPIENSAQDHQRKNAYEYAGEGAAIVIEEQNLAPHLLMSEIRKLFENPARMRQMSEAAGRFSRIDAATIIAREILTLGLH